jgi:hypothetical protein
MIEAAVASRGYPVGRILTTLFVLSGGVPALAQEPEESGPCGQDETAVTGIVADMLSRRPLPGATVSLQAPASFVEQLVAHGTAGANGTYTLCVDRIGQGWQIIAQLDTLVSRAIPVTPGVVVDTVYLAWSRPVTIAGAVRIQGTRQPLEAARVSIEGRPVRAVTDDAGRFALRGIGAGPLVIVTSHIGYAPRTDTILVESGANISLDITLGEQAIELDPIVVTARTPPSLRARGANDLGMTRAQVAVALPRSIDFVSMLRQANVPGLLVTATGGPDGPCIQFLRSSGGCAMVQVFVNGNRVSNPGLMVSSMDPSMVAEFFVLRPAFAQFQYMGPLTPNGVLDIILK